MIGYEEMQYLIAFAKTGTLSEVAEQFHISQPTVTRSMKHIEEEFGVALFERTKNSIKLNEIGLLAAEEAEMVIKQTDGMLRRVRAYDRASHTISIGTSAAVQIPELIRQLSESYPEMSISSELKKPEALMNGLRKDTYQLIILPYRPDDTDLISIRVGEENLMFFLTRNHRFAKRKSLTLAEMNGENMLLFSEIGFWRDLVTQKMPDSRFLVQNERYTLEELIVNSVLPCFITNLSGGNESLKEKRVCVPIADPEVNVTYYLVCKRENGRRFGALFGDGDWHYNPNPMHTIQT